MKKITAFTNCIKIVRRDGKKITLTDHVNAIHHQEDIYLPGIFKSISGVSKNSALNNEKFIIYCVLDNQIFNLKDIQLGCFFLARVNLLFIDYFDPKTNFYMKNGYIKNIILESNNDLIIQVVDYSHLLSRNISDKFSNKCRAILGDKKCSVNLRDYTFTGQVTKEINNYEFIDEGRVEEVGYFDYGKIKFTSVSNVDIEYAVERYINGKISLFNQAVEKILVSSQYEIIAGCNKNIQTCEKKFNNILNFRGEPYLK